jgi:hypothetical protein
MTQMPRVMLLVAPVMMPLGLARQAGQQMSPGTAAVVRAGARLCWTLRLCSCRCVVGGLIVGVGQHLLAAC